jgi:hypothetical protein
MLTFDYCVKLDDFECQHWARAVSHCKELIQREECRIYSRRTSVSEGYQREYCFEFQHRRQAVLFALKFM